MERKIKEVEEQMEQFKAGLEQLQGVVARLDEQAEKRIEARIRERELEARILEAKNKWRPKDWFILSGIIGAVVVALAGLAVTVVLAFSYVPRTTTTTTTTTVEDVMHSVDTSATDYATNTTTANFTVH